MLLSGNPGSNEKSLQIETNIEKQKNEIKTEKCQQQQKKASSLCLNELNEQEKQSEVSTLDCQTETLGSMENEIETTFRVPIKKYRSIVGKGKTICK